MPYTTNHDLPVRIQAHLPRHAQDIFRKAFNHAWRQYADDPRREEVAFRVAWAAVKKRGYHKADGDWVAAESAPADPIEDTLKAEHMLDSVLFRER